MVYFKLVSRKNRNKLGFVLKKSILFLLPVIFIVALVFLIQSLLSRSVISVLPLPPENAAYKNSTLSDEKRVEDLLSYMTLDEKIGQMALVEKNSIVNTDDISLYGIGAVLSGAGGKPTNNTPEGWKEMVAGYSQATQGSRLGIPILYGADSNHGNGNVPEATIFPHAIGLGATNNPPLVEQVARATAIESKVLGINWNFSPALDLPTDIRWGRVYEEFSDDPNRTGLLGAAYIKGLQNQTTTSNKVNVLATAKHFIGIGSTGWGTSLNKNFKIDQGVVPASEKALRNEYLIPFRSAVDAGVLSVMVGLGNWGDSSIATNKYLITDVLKNELKFKGFVVSDWYGVYEFSENKYKSVVDSINAGVDMAMLPYDYKTFGEQMREAVVNGDVAESRINDAVRRILTVKFAMGLFDNKVADASLINVVGSTEHRQLARKVVSQSLVLLKNDNNILPIKKDINHIRVAGSSADNFGRQAGAWTVEWQGIDGNWIKGTTSILAGIKSVVSNQTKVEYDINGNFLTSNLADIGIAVVGEKPYAEGWGDKAEPRLDDADLLAIANLKKTCKKVIVVLVSGRPLLITDQVSNWDALVMAWLPGSEGAGVSDVLWGGAEFVGTLPLPWPKTIKQLPFSYTGKSADGTSALWSRGFGLQ